MDYTIPPMGPKTWNWYALMKNVVMDVITNMDIK